MYDELVRELKSCPDAEKVVTHWMPLPETPKEEDKCSK